ncbi:hypothetical protein I7I48_10256 [Histoplasma ohiense]|nr:hypothetical protein I7I48_10256 [Histoplasma ohiense (nom. inval.)]
MDGWIDDSNLESMINSAKLAIKVQYHLRSISDTKNRYRVSESLSNQARNLPLEEEMWLVWCIVRSLANYLLVWGRGTISVL